jgi:hypothetical protein
MPRTDKYLMAVGVTIRNLLPSEGAAPPKRTTCLTKSDNRHTPAYFSTIQTLARPTNCSNIVRINTRGTSS